MMCIALVIVTGLILGLKYLYENYPVALAVVFLLGLAYFIGDSFA
jgi:hypothetical protein